ncbi:MAG TPA: hypothetical protein VFD00_06805 [Thermoclostridium sp.]|nr:hypothetical protein [Thermoclostridium sp.]
MSIGRRHEKNRKIEPTKGQHYENQNPLTVFMQELTGLFWGCRQNASHYINKGAVAQVIIDFILYGH